MSKQPITFLSMALAMLCASSVCANDVFIKNATIYVSPSEKLESANLLIRNGKIAAVGNFLGRGN